MSHVETRQVRNDYTLQWEGELYQIARQAITTGLRGANVRVEKRLDGEVVVRYGEKYLPVKLCVAAEKKVLEPPPVKQPGKRGKRQPDRTRSSPLCSARCGEGRS